ncbi:ATP-binding protein [Streptomyces aidingensis]
MRFTSTPRGARLARRLVSHRLDCWGHPYDSQVNETLTLITSELAANAVRHGVVPGRDFHVRLAAFPDRLRVEVTDTRTERFPVPAFSSPPAARSQSRSQSPSQSEPEGGRGLLLVAHLATRWGAAPRPVTPGKTVWAELRLPSCPPGGAVRSGGDPVGELQLAGDGLVAPGAGAVVGGVHRQAHEGESADQVADDGRDLVPDQVVAE